MHRHFPFDILLFFSLAAFFLPGCVKEEILPADGDGVLQLSPSIFSLTTKGSEAGDDDRGENSYARLDVFIKESGAGSFAAADQYHLDPVKGAGQKELLERNWKPHYPAGKTYDVYVIANGPDAIKAGVRSWTLAELEAVIQEDAAIYDIQKKADDYAVSAEEEARGFSPYVRGGGTKSLMMDGHATWTPTADVNQVIPVSLKRAAAKIRLNVTFDPGFLGGLKTVGVPMVKYVNFAASSEVIDTDGIPYCKNSKTLSASSRKYFSAVDGDNHEYSLTAYSYACLWDPSDLEEKGLTGAPYALVSFAFTREVDGKDVQTLNYYRIPITDSSSLERNHIYTVNVEINSVGNTREETSEVPANIAYDVLEWTPETSNVTNVVAERMHYFIVSTTEGTIQGDGEQQFVIDYYVPQGATITQSNVDVYYYNKSGGKETSEATIDINQTKHTVTVTSTALDNHGVKYIKFRLSYTYTEGGISRTISHDIFLRHFPLENIQSLAGWYSYKYGRSYIDNPSGGNWNGYDFIACSKEEYDNSSEQGPIGQVDSGTPANHDSETIETIAQKGGSTSFQYGISKEAGRQKANGKANAKLHDGWWYWGENPVTTESGEYDYHVRNGNNYTYYKYQTYKRAKFYLVQYTVRKYYQTVPDAWVRWIPDSNVGYSGSKITADGVMSAKVYDASTNRIRRINAPVNGRATMGGNVSSSLDYHNNRMYILRITTTSERFTVGRPVLDQYSQSQDDVVSPAFMIASQLGVFDIGNYGDGGVAAAKAAFHCAEYVESIELTGTTSREYKGWRLPTRSEIETIASYQQAQSGTAAVIDKVLTAKRYFTLDGGYTELVHPSDPDYYEVKSYPFVRCVRDLTPEEVAEINARE